MMYTMPTIRSPDDIVKCSPQYGSWKGGDTKNQGCHVNLSISYHPPTCGPVEHAGATGGFGGHRGLWPLTFFLDLCGWLQQKYTPAVYAWPLQACSAIWVIPCQINTKNFHIPRFFDVPGIGYLHDKLWQRQNFSPMLLVSWDINSSVLGIFHYLSL